MTSFNNFFFIFVQGEITYIWFFQLNETKVSNSQDNIFLIMLNLLFLRIAKHGVTLSLYNSRAIQFIELISTQWKNKLLIKKKFFRASVLISIKLYSYINQTLHKAYLGKGNSNLFKRKSTPFPRGDDSNIVNILWCLLNIFSRTDEHNQGIQHFESRGFKSFQINFLN